MGMRLMVATKKADFSDICKFNYDAPALKDFLTENGVEILWEASEYDDLCNFELALSDVTELCESLEKKDPKGIAFEGHEAYTNGEVAEIFRKFMAVADKKYDILYFSWG